MLEDRVLPLSGGQVGDEGEGVLILAVRVDQRVQPAAHLGDAAQLPLADALVQQVDELGLHPPLLEPAFGLAGVAGFFGTEDLDVHFPSSAFSSSK